MPIGFNTDVNGAALGEFRFGAGRGTSGMAYVTVGTGIGGGLIVDGNLANGAGHPEMGHYYPHRGANDSKFGGNCPFHGDCLEGLASGPAILSRWGKTLSELPDEHEAHDLVAGYLAQLCHTLFACCAIERVVLGGGVMHTQGLLKRVGDCAAKLGVGLPAWSGFAKSLFTSAGDRQRDSRCLVARRRRATRHRTCVTKSQVEI